MLPMRKPVVMRLLELNQNFYNTFARSFRDSRSHTEPGLERALAHVPPGSRVLDLGCGQGRLAGLLPPGCAYTGVDYAIDLLSLAPRSVGNLAEAPRWVAGDLVTDEWIDNVGHGFDWVVLRAVLHHIPSAALRAEVVSRAADRLQLGGKMLIANWQFLRIPRLRSRVLPWAAVGLSDADVDPGDYLLDWQRDGRGLRYVHLLDEAETRRLATDAGLLVEDLYYADGHTNDLTLYALLTRDRDG